MTFTVRLNKSNYCEDLFVPEGDGGGGGKRRGLGPRNDVLTTCKAVTLRGGQRIIALALFPKQKAKQKANR